MSVEQEARGILSRLGVDRYFANGDLVELANVLHERDVVREQVRNARLLLRRGVPSGALGVLDALAERLGLS